MKKSYAFIAQKGGTGKTTTAAAVGFGLYMRGCKVLLIDLDAQGNRITTKLKSTRKNRYAISAEYDKNEYTLRAEYIHSQGWGTDAAWGDKADGWYAFGIVPVIKSKLHAKARYNVYRRSKDWESSKTMYEIGANYFFNKKLQLNFEYARVNDRTQIKHNYNFVDVELDFRF